MLSLTGVALRRGPKLLFQDVTFQVHAGQRLALVGANGSGKTSLFALLLGDLQADAGEVRLPADALIAHVSQSSPAGDRSALDFVMDGDRGLRKLQQQIALTQERGQTDALHSLFEQLEHIDGYAAESRAARLLYGLGFDEEDGQRPVDAFSGGWRMRLNLAQALMCRSDILLLDEPTNHLDLPAILWLESWLRRYPGILLLVSHDRDFLDALSTRVAHIENGLIRLYTGNYSDFEGQRAEQLAQQEALYKRQQKEIGHIQSYVDRFRYKASKARQAQSRLKMLERMTRIVPAHVDSPFDFSFPSAPAQPQHLLRLEEVTAGYDQPVLRGIDLMVSASDRVGLLGVNGAGKSTLVKALADGSTILAGNRIQNRNTRIGYFAQHQLDLLEPDRSPLDHLRAVSPDASESELRRHLGSFGFSGERIFDPVAPFSGGEKARLVLAMIIREQPNLLLLDEPTNHLDLEMRQALSRALLSFDGAIILISHDRHLLRMVCDELVLVNDGEVARFNGSLEDYLQWLAERQSVTRQNAPEAEQAEEAQTGNQTLTRREQRQLNAQHRLALKPLTDRLREIESRLSGCRNELAILEGKISDPDLYRDRERQDELTDLLRDQAKLRAGIQALEDQWLEAGEALETASATDARPG